MGFLLGLLLRLPFLLPEHESLEAAADSEANIARAVGHVLWALATGWLNADDAGAARAVAGVAGSGRERC